MQALLFSLTTPSTEKVIFLMDVNSSFITFAKVKSDDYWHVGHSLLSELCFYRPLPTKIFLLNFTNSYASELELYLKLNFAFLKIEIWDNIELEKELVDFASFLKDFYPSNFMLLIWNQVRFFNILKKVNWGINYSPMEVFCGHPWAENVNDVDEEECAVKLVQHKFGKIAEALLKKPIYLE